MTKTVQNAKKDLKNYIAEFHCLSQILPIFLFNKINSYHHG